MRNILPTLTDVFLSKRMRSTVIVYVHIPIGSRNSANHNTYHSLLRLSSSFGQASGAQAERPRPASHNQLVIIVIVIVIMIISIINITVIIIIKIITS